MSTQPLFGASVCLSILSVSAVAMASAEEKITATIGAERVVATVDASTRAVKSAKVERRATNDGSWSKQTSETAALTDSLESEPPVLPSSFVDCNDNGLDDLVEIADGAADVNVNFVPDACEYGYGDLNLDGEVDGNDMFIVFGWFSAPIPVFGDLNNDGTVDGADMGVLLARWGSSPF